MELDPVGSAVRCEMMKLCSGSVKHSNGGTDCDPSHTDRQTLKDRATQLLLEYKSGALVMQFLQQQQAEKLMFDDE